MILVINLGLKSIRSIIFDYKGSRISLAREPINSYLKSDFVEQDANEWKIKFFRVIKKSIIAAGKRCKINYITVTCSSSCLILVNKKFEPIHPIIMVSDKRAGKQAKKINSLTTLKKLNKNNKYNITNYSQISRILWIKENKPQIFKKVYKFLSPNDYLIGLLLDGETFTDPLNAEKFMYDEKTLRYVSEIYSQISIDTNLLPACLEIGSNLGTLDSKVAKDLNLKNKPEVILTTYDAITSIFGGGGIEDGTVNDQSGTISSIRMYSKKKYIDNKSRVFCQYYKPTNGYFIGGSNNLGGGLIEWSKDVFYKNSNDAYRLMDLESRKANDFSFNQGALLFSPNLMGSRTPDWNPDERGTFFGIERFHSRGDFMRSIFESIAFTLKDIIEIIGKGSTKPKKIIGGGGLSRIPIANELKSTITGLPFYTSKEFEITALGAAIIVLTTNKHYTSTRQAMSSMNIEKQKILPNNKYKNYYEDLYNYYLELKKESYPLYKKHRQIINSNLKKKDSSLFNL